MQSLEIHMNHCEPFHLGRGDGPQGRAGDGQLGVHDGAAQHQLCHLPPGTDTRLTRSQAINNYYAIITGWPICSRTRLC